MLWNSVGDRNVVHFPVSPSNSRDEVGWAQGGLLLLFTVEVGLGQRFASCEFDPSKVLLEHFLLNRSWLLCNSVREIKVGLAVTPCVAELSAPFAPPLRLMSLAQRQIHEGTAVSLPG